MHVAKIIIYKCDKKIEQYTRGNENITSKWDQLITSQNFAHYICKTNISW